MTRKAPPGARQAECVVCNRKGWCVERTDKLGQVWVQCIGPCANSDEDVERRVQLSNELNIAPWDIEVLTYVNENDVLVEKVVSRGKVIQERQARSGSSG